VIVVIDTNVWVSGLQFAKQRGIPTLALEKAMSEDVIATCDEINAEIFRVLTEKFLWEPRRVAAALGRIMTRMVHVKIRGAVKACRDPKDDMFLECAVLAKAALIVAGDQDLLTLGSYKQIRIVNPAEYVKGA
jgi:putative PIN family toxin of toxin-antitoxin system